MIGDHGWRWRATRGIVPPQCHRRAALRSLGELGGGISRWCSVQDLVSMGRRWNPPWQGRTTLDDTIRDEQRGRHWRERTVLDDTVRDYQGLSLDLRGPLFAEILGVGSCSPCFQLTIARTSGWPCLFFYPTDQC